MSVLFIVQTNSGRTTNYRTGKTKTKINLKCVWSVAAGKGRYEKFQCNTMERVFNKPLMIYFVRQPHFCLYLLRFEAMTNANALREVKEQIQSSLNYH